jgi:AcrR family transcriptional regulator
MSIVTQHTSTGTAGGSTATGGAGKPQGRPRSAQADEAIVQAVLEMLGEGSTVESLSMESVAARAGVGKATVYRRWSHKEALVVDAIGRLKGNVPDPPGNSVREDLVTLVNAMWQARDSQASKLMPCLAPEIKRNPELYRRWITWVEDRREVMRDVLRRGVLTGELRPDLDIELALAILTGPTTLQSALSWHPQLTKENLPERVVDAVLSGIRGPNA